MKFKILKIIFKNPDELFIDLENVLAKKNRSNISDKNTYVFDSIRSYQQFLTTTKIQVLRGISQLQPESIYQLASFLGREPNHLLRDCRQLEFYKFIKLIPVNNKRGSLKPKLYFDYDLITSDSAILPVYAISAKAEAHLLLG